MPSGSRSQSRVPKPATPVYRAGQTARQIRFPGRRKVVKKYGKVNTDTSPKQRTLTQIGYILDAPPNELQGVEVAADADGGCPRTPGEVVIDADGRLYGNSAMPSDRQTANKLRSSTPCGTAKSLLATPMNGGFEIPSSQPSPFTPMTLSSHSQNFSGDLQLSPLEDKRLALQHYSGHVAKRRKASQPPDFPLSHIDLELHSRVGCSNPGRSPRSRHSRTKELVVSDKEMRSSSQERPGHGAALHEVCSPQDDGAKAEASFTHDPTTCPSRQGMDTPRLTVEIPDTDDEEEDEVDNGPCFAFRDSAATPRQETGVQKLYGIFSKSPLSSFDLLSPSVLELRTPTLQPQELRFHSAVGVERDKITRPTIFFPGLGGQLVEKQLSVQSQGLESQRVPLDVIRCFEPHTDRSDIIVCTDPVQVQGMVDGTRKYEVRSFKIPRTVCRIWIYVTEPVCELRYMAVIDARFQQTSEIDNRCGTGAMSPRTGSVASQFAYRLMQVYQLNNPVSLGTMKKNGWIDGPPTRYTYIPPAVVGFLLSNLRCVLVDNAQDGEAGLNNIVSQGVELQHADDTSETWSYLRQAFSATKDDEQKSVAGSFGLVSSSPAAFVNVPQCKTHTTDSFKDATGSASAVQGPAFPDTPNASTMAKSGRPSPFATPCRGDDTWRIEDTQGAPAVGRTTSAVQAQPQRKPRQEVPFQPPTLSETGVSQLELPDSLYEEMRQAPLAIVLDSEDSEDE